MNAKRQKKFIRELSELPSVKFEFALVREIGGFLFSVHPCSSVFIRG
jgi:hypothetical protein